MEERLKLLLVQELVMYSGKDFYLTHFEGFLALKVWGGENFELSFIWSSESSGTTKFDY